MHNIEHLLLTALLVAPRTRKLTMAEHLAVYEVALYVHRNRAHSH